jgi:hypothetical protein
MLYVIGMFPGMQCGVVGLLCGSLWSSWQTTAGSLMSDDGWQAVSGIKVLFY